MKTDEAIKKELADLDLCYKAFGVPLAATPKQIEEKYKQLADICKGEMKSPSKKVREEAEKNLAFFDEMYKRITSSVTYKTMVKESEKMRGREARPEIISMKTSLIYCPKCNAMVGKGLKICPKCKTPFSSKTELMSGRYLTKKTVIVFSLVLLLGVMACIAVSYSDQLAGLFGR